MTEAPGKKSLARNTAFAMLGHGIALAVPILVTPYIVHRIGLELYGIWAALNVLVLLISQYDFGLWNAIARETAARRARGDHDGLRTLLSTCFAYDMVVSPLLFGLILLVGPALLHRLLPGIPPALAFPVLLMLTVQAVFMPWLRHATQALHGMQRVDLASLVSIVATPLSVVGVVIFLETGMGLLGLAINGVIFLVLQLVALVVMLRLHGFPVSFSPFRYDPGEHRALLRFGGKVEVGRLLIMLFRVDRLLLTALGIPAAQVGTYQLGASLSDRLGSTVGVLSSGVLPATSDLAARGDTDRVRVLFMRATKYHALATAGLIGFAVLFGSEIMMLWMGRALPASVDILRIMAVGGACFTIVWPAYAVGIGLGRAWLQAISTGIGLAGAVLLYMTLGRRYDVEGLAWAVSLGMALGQVIQMIGLRGTLAFNWREYVGNALLKPLALAAPLATVYGLWLVLEPHLPPVDGRLSALTVIGPAFLLTIGLGWVAARAFRVIDAVDLDLLKSIGRRTPA